MGRSKYEHLKEEFIKHYKSGKSVSEIARMYDIPNKASVSKLIKQDMILRPKTLFNESMEPEALELYKKGVTKNALAKMFNTSSGTIEIALSKYIKVEKNIRYKHLLEDIKKEYEKGLSSLQIAEKHGISVATVCLYLHLEGDGVRELEEANRQNYKLDYDYFKIDNLNKDRIKDFVKINPHVRAYNNRRLKISCKLDYFEEELKPIVSKFINIDKKVRIIDEIYCAFEIISKRFFNNYIELSGNILKTEFKDFFMEEYLKENISFQRKRLFINIRHLNEEEFAKCLGDSIGNDEFPVGIHLAENSISVEKGSIIESMIKRYPFIKEKFLNSIDKEDEVLYKNISKKIIKKEIIMSL